MSCVCHRWWSRQIVDHMQVLACLRKQPNAFFRSEFCCKSFFQKKLRSKPTGWSWRCHVASLIPPLPPFMCICVCAFSFSLSAMCELFCFLFFFFLLAGLPLSPVPHFSSVKWIVLCACHIWLRQVPIIFSPLCCCCCASISCFVFFWCGVVAGGSWTGVSSSLLFRQSPTPPCANTFWIPKCPFARRAAKNGLIARSVTRRKTMSCNERQKWYRSCVCVCVCVCVCTCLWDVVDSISRPMSRSLSGRSCGCCLKIFYSTFGLHRIGLASFFFTLIRCLHVKSAKRCSARTWHSLTSPMNIAPAVTITTTLRPRRRKMKR